jgi:hypothetical protein
MPFGHPWNLTMLATAPAVEMTGALRVRLLGQFHLTFDGRPALGPITARLQSLLAYLLLHADAPQSRAHLSFLFWPDTIVLWAILIALFGVFHNIFSRA